MDLSFSNWNFFLKLFVCQFNFPGFSLCSLSHCLFFLLFSLKLSDQISHLLFLLISFTVKPLMLLLQLLFASFLFVQDFFILSVFFSSILFYTHAFSLLFFELLSNSVNCWFVRSSVFELFDSFNKVFALSLHWI